MGISIFLLVLGILGIISGLSLYKKSNKVASWPRTDAHITKKAIKDTDKAVGANPGFRKEMDIEFEYTFEGKGYTASTYSYTALVTSEKGIQKQLDKLPDDVQVCVNPENPSEAYVKIPSKTLAIIVLSVGVVFSMAFVLYTMG